ncbi:hypothetical protein AO268_04385 [Pseudomonas sp. ICMP 8385]|nr:hypothetical protein AO268_04385 [Pseudomonas sp. ICMP 8385]
MTINTMLPATKESRNVTIGGDITVISPMAQPRGIAAERTQRPVLRKELLCSSNKRWSTTRKCMAIEWVKSCVQK